MITKWWYAQSATIVQRLISMKIPKTPAHLYAICVLVQKALLHVLMDIIFHSICSWFFCQSIQNTRRVGCTCVSFHSFYNGDMHIIILILQFFKNILSVFYFRLILILYILVERYKKRREKYRETKKNRQIIP